MSLEYLIVQMNSNLFNYQFKQLGIDLGKAFEWKKQYVEKIYIPTFDLNIVSKFCKLYNDYITEVIDNERYEHVVNLYIYKELDLSHKEVLIIDAKFHESEEKYNNLSVEDIAKL